MTLTVERPLLPDGALLQKYRRAGAYTDCFSVDVPGAVSLAQFLSAVCSPRKLKRWRVEEQTNYQILLTDRRDRRRTWLLAKQMPAGAGTRLYFGSAAVPKMSLWSRVTLGLHLRRSQALLRAAAQRLIRQSPRPRSPASRPS